ncbi:MAG: GAF domain-containing protein [Anaerolineae bacterium]|nr:GAF domain-containing protein [Anaerolineae bacterium]
MLKKISIYWIILAALLLTGAVPLGVVSYRAIQTTRTEVKRAQQDQLIARADAHAATIDEQFRTFESATRFAAAQAEQLLVQDDLDPNEVQARLARYQRDSNNVYGLDSWYENEYDQSAGDRLSNVFVNQNTELTPQIAFDIVATEALDLAFNSILDSDIGTQWIYLTTAEGMMRLFPWHANLNYPVDWEPQTISFYTVANQVNDPRREPVWTAPYYDFAGAGLMVTNSVPIYDGGVLRAVMSHDLRIDVMTEQVLGFKVGDKGFAFLLDNEGHIIAHRDYNPEQFAQDAPLGEEQFILLAQEDPNMESIVETMLTEGGGVRDYIDKDGKKWLVVFTEIPTTDWHFAMMQPYAEIVEPADKIIDQVITGLVALVVFVLMVSIWLARRITRPVLQLSKTAKEIERSVDAETAEAIEPTLRQLSNISSAREITNLASVFEQMVLALQKRMNQLDSVYAMGQTITAQVDFDQTVQAVLAAVGNVVGFDAAEVTVASGEDLIVEAWRGQPDFNDTTGRKYRIGRGPTGMIAATKTPVFMSVLGGEEDMKRTLGYAAAGTGEFLAKTTKVVINSFLGIPLLIGDRLVGTLTLVHHEAGYFSEDDKRQLNKLAAQASIAIDNAIQVRQRESALKAQIRELRVEIDRAKVSEQVAEITTTDYFQQIRANAARMRERVYTRDRKIGDEPDHEIEKGEDFIERGAAMDTDQEPPDATE